MTINLYPINNLQFTPEEWEAINKLAVQHETSVEAEISQLVAEKLEELNKPR
jgi:hypothetical protein